MIPIGLQQIMRAMREVEANIDDLMDKMGNLAVVGNTYNPYQPGQVVTIPSPNRHEGENANVEETWLSMSKSAGFIWCVRGVLIGSELPFYFDQPITDCPVGDPSPSPDLAFLGQKNECA